MQCLVRMVCTLHGVVAGIDGCMDGIVDVMDTAVDRDVLAFMGQSVDPLAVDE